MLRDKHILGSNTTRGGSRNQLAVAKGPKQKSRKKVLGTTGYKKPGHIPTAKARGDRERKRGRQEFGAYVAPLQPCNTCQTENPFMMSSQPSSLNQKDKADMEELKKKFQQGEVAQWIHVRP